MASAKKTAVKLSQKKERSENSGGASRFFKRQKYKDKGAQKKQKGSDTLEVESQSAEASESENNTAELSKIKSSSSENDTSPTGDVEPEDVPDAENPSKNYVSHAQIVLETKLPNDLEIPSTDDQSGHVGIVRSFSDTSALTEKQAQASTTAVLAKGRVEQPPNEPLFSNTYSLREEGLLKISPDLKAAEIPLRILAHHRWHDYSSEFVPRSRRSISNLSITSNSSDSSSVCENVALDRESRNILPRVPSPRIVLPRDKGSEDTGSDCSLSSSGFSPGSPASSLLRLHSHEDFSDDSDVGLVKLRESTDYSDDGLEFDYTTRPKPVCKQLQIVTSLECTKQAVTRRASSPARMNPGAFLRRLSGSSEMKEHLRFVEYLKKCSLSEYLHYFTPNMTLGMLRVLTEDDLTDVYHIEDTKVKQKLMIAIVKSREESDTDTEMHMANIWKGASLGVGIQVRLNGAGRPKSKMSSCQIVRF